MEELELELELKPPSPDGCPKSSVLHGRYELGRVLGQGTFAKVYMARNLRSGEAVAIKAVCKDKVIQSGMMEQIKREISVMKRISHPNIISLHEVMATRSKIYFSMELVRGGELFSRLARAGRLREDSARHYFRQLLSAVAFCHSRGVYHRDLKPENLLLDHNGTLKIADFGLTAFADHVRHDGLLHTTCGTPAYVAPEVIGRRGYDGAKADLWSCGVILYVLLAGFLPFQDENLIAMYKKIQRGDFKCPPWFSPDARRVVTRLLDPNPSTRITAAKLLDAPWFRRSPPPPPPLPLPRPPPAAAEEEEEPERMNAFHLISLSEGFDLSALFEEGGREEGVRFATRETASGVISRLEGMRGMRVTKSGAMGVMLEGEEGRLLVVAEIFAVSPEVMVVEVRKAGGDNVEYKRFCSDELRPALKDIVWDTRDAAA